MPENMLSNNKQYLDVLKIENATQMDISKYQTMCKVHRFLLRLKKDTSQKLLFLLALVLLSNGVSCLTYNLILARLDSKVVDLLFALKILVFDITACLKIADLFLLKKDLKKEINSVIDDIDAIEDTFEVPKEVTKPKKMRPTDRRNKQLVAASKQNQNLNLPILSEFKKDETLEDIPEVAVSGATLDTIYPNIPVAKPVTRVREKFHSYY